MLNIDEESKEFNFQANAYIQNVRNDDRRWRGHLFLLFLCSYADSAAIEDVNDDSTFSCACKVSKHRCQSRTGDAAVE